MEAQADAGDRVVDRDRDGAADPVEVTRVEIDVRTARGREDAHHVPKQAQLAGEMLDVVGDPAWRGEVIRRNEPDLHEAPPPTAAGRVGDGAPRRADRLMANLRRCDAARATDRDAAG